MSRVGRMVVRVARVAAGIAGAGVKPDRLRRAVAGRVVLVTGASEGIGAATARRLGEAGATVLLVARTAERLAEVCGEIEAAGGTARPYQCDLSDPEAAAELGRLILREQGRVDVVVSNAGRSIRRSLTDSADRFHDVRRTIDLNYLGPVRLLMVLLPAMRAVGAGHVVNVSTAGLATPAQNWSSYLASKSAFDVWLRCAAPELRADGVSVSSVYFGLVRTRMSAPTRHYRRMPAMSPDEAAAVVCRAVARRTRTLQSWWSRIGAVLATAFVRPVEGLLEAQVRLVRATAPLRALSRTGALRPMRMVRLALAARRFGPTLAAAAASGPRDAVALIDESGEVTYRELHAAAVACAAGLYDRLGVRPGHRVAVACGPHRGFAVATVALGLIGADAVLLAADLPADRCAEVLSHQGVMAVVHDGLAAGRFPDGIPTVGWSTLSTGAGVAVPARGEAATVPLPPHPGRLVVLTSGTTGVPRGVQRRLTLRGLLGPVGTHLDVIPVRYGVPIMVATPPHHGYGLTYLAAGLALGAPVVFGAGLDAERLLADTSRHRAGVLCALPIQLARICELAEWPDLDSLSAVVTGAAPLSPALSERVLRRFGDRVFNLYGATESGWATLATPADLRTAPGTVGRPPRGIRVTIVDGAGRPLPPGTVGEVHVDGWQNGGGPVGTGDLGRLDDAGRLFLVGRTDDMVVSGGENVYPMPVAEALAAHPGIADALVAPVSDEEFGQRLRAFVVPRPASEVSEEELRGWLRTRLSRAEQPRDIVFVNDLPRTATGKPVAPRTPAP